MIFLLCVGLAAPPSPVPGQEPAQGSLYDRAARASVEILVAGRLKGSGWFATPEGDVVTAAHIVWAAEDPIEVRTRGRGRLAARVVAFDRGHDLALLKVPAAAVPYPSLPLGNGMPEPPSEIYLFGAVQFRHGLLLSGKVARKTPTFEYFPDQGCAVRVFHVAGPSPKGSSGGCWIDAKGRVIGLQSGMMMQGSAASGIAFVAPPGAVRRLVERRRSARTIDAGVAVEELEERNAKFIRKFPPGTRGVVAAVLIKGGPAETAGLPKDALIIRIDGDAVETRDAFYGKIRSYEKGKAVVMEFRRPGAKTVERVQCPLAVLEDRPKK